MSSSAFAPDAVTRVRLPNGLTVLVYRNTTAPVVAINTYVKAGYFDETDDIVGIAHVLEHMFFKGTTRRGVGEIAKETKSVGGYLNAHTIYDHTSYYTVLPASGFAQGLDIQADAYTSSVIDADELRKELEVIIQEAKRKDDNPNAVTTESLYTLLYDAHRIRRWRIGREAELRALTREQVVGFYQNFYTPSNTVLVIAGDVSPDDALKRVEQLYGSLPAKEPVRSPGPSELEHTGARYLELQGDVAQTQIAFGWRTVPTAHEDTPALNMAACVLSAGRASRLYRAVRERKLAGSVSAYNYSPVELGVFTTHIEAEYATAGEAARAVWAQLQTVRGGAVTTDEIERVKQLFKSRWARRLETMEGRAAYLAEWESQGEWEQGDAYYDTFLKLTAQDVHTVARRYLTPENMSTVVYRPATEPTVAADATAFQKYLDAGYPEPLSQLTGTRPSSQAISSPAAFAREEDGIRVYNTPKQIPILVARRPGAAITHIGIYAAGGAVDEPPAHAGITTLTARMTVKGTTTRSALQIAEESELLGGSIGASAGTESFGWTFSVPRENTEAALVLLGDVVQHATLDADTLETERRALLSELSQLRDDMYRYPMRLLTGAAYPNHPYGTPASGTESSVQSITSNDIHAWYHTKLKTAQYVIGIVGDVDPDQIAGLTAHAFSELSFATHPAISAPVWPSKIIERAEPREKAQTAIALGFPAPNRTDDARFAAYVLSTVASGLGGRFFDELRDKQSLAYTVHAFASEYRYAGLFISYIATSPEKETIARAGLLHEFDKLRETPITDIELVRAKRYILGMHDIRQERAGAILSDMLDAWLFGSGLHELTAFPSHIQSVTATDIQQLAQRYFTPSHRIETIIRGTPRSS